MKRGFFIVSFLLFTLVFIPQNSSESNILMQSAEENLYTNPAQTIRISEQILKNSTNPLEIKKASLLLSKSYFVSGEYKESLTYFFEGINLNSDNFTNSSDINSNEIITLEYLIHGIEIFKFLGVDELKIRYSKDAEILLKNYESKSHQLNLAYLNLDTIEKESFLNELLIDIGKIEKNTQQGFMPLKAIIFNDLAKIKLEQGNFQEAKKLFESSLNNLTKGQSLDFFTMQTLIELAQLYFKKNNYEAALDALYSAEKISDRFNNSFFELKLYEQLTQNYLALDRKDKFIEYNLLSGNTYTILNTQESLASNALFNILQNQHLNQKNQLLDKIKSIRFYLIATLIAMGLVWIVVKLFFMMNLKHRRDLVNYLKLIEETERKVDNSTKKTEVKPLGIPKETEELILQKLEKFESGNKYISKEMSLAQLSAMVETNSKYLSEVINKHKSKNFNLYINSLRIKYIVKKLKTDPNYLNYKVSYLAEECGFSSHSSFATVFKNITGISPNVFIELLKKDKNNNLKISA